MSMATTTTTAAGSLDASRPGSQKAAVFRNAGKKFDGQWVVRNLDFEIAEGTILGLVGPSGSGKTTMVRMANGVYNVDEGSIEVFGTAPAHFSTKERTSIGYLPQTPVLFDALSLWENLNFHASLNGVRLRRRARLEELLELVDLTGHEKKLVRESSGGMKRRLALAATLVHQPRLVMLDEPTAGIDPILRRRFWEHFRELRDRGHTLMITTQYVGEAADCDVVGLLANGSIAAYGTPDDLRREAYGGEIIELEVASAADRTLVGELHRIDGVHSVDHVDTNRLRMIVTDGGNVLPQVVQQAQTAGHEVVDSEEVVPVFDDVFIELVGRTFAEAGKAAEDGQTATAPQTSTAAPAQGAQEPSPATEETS